MNGGQAGGQAGGQGRQNRACGLADKILGRSAKGLGTSWSFGGHLLYYGKLKKIGQHTLLS